MISIHCKVGKKMIDEAVDLYLEKKTITEKDIIKNGSNNLTQTPLKMLHSSILEYHTSQNNTYIYSCTTQSITQMDAEFVKLKTWICDMESTEVKQELSQILFPIFCHLYLDAVCDGNNQHVPAAVIFFKRHQSLFTCESLRDIMKDIGNIFKKEQVENKPLVKAFRSAKCELNLSSTSATLLKKFISNSDEPMILLNVLNSWFIIEDNYNNAREDDDPAVCPESEIIMGRRIENCSSPEKINYDDSISSDSDKDDNDESQIDFSNGSFKSLATTFKNLRNSIPQPSPLLLLQMQKSQNVTCSSVCYPSKLLAVGNLFSNLEVFSFSEERVTLPQKNSLSIKINIPYFNFNLEDKNNCEEKHYSILRGHTGSVSSVKFLRNPDIILSTSEDKTLRAWRGNNFSCAAVYRGHNNPIWALDVSALNMYIATGSHDKTARLWILDKTYPLRLFAGHYGSITCLKFHPNGMYLGTGSVDKTVRLFSVIDGKIARLFTGHSGPVHCLSFSPNGQYLASGGDCKEVIIWNLALGQQYISVDTDSQFVCDLSWNLDSSILVVTFQKQYIYLLYVPTSLKNEYEIIGKYSLPNNRFISCQYMEKNNLIAVSII